jgi:tetratricopeptide (TPR) repeat protein
VAPLSAAASASPNTARYHGDLAYALARLSRWDTAAVEYASAARLQPANPWYDVGLAAVRAELGQWEQAKANLQAAVALDSSIIDRRVVAAAIECMEQGGFGPELVVWLRIATARYPDDPAPWFRLATLLRQTDSTEGLAAIRRYRALAPDQLAGAALYALYLLGVGQYDSALALARAAAADTALRQYAWPVFLQFGAQLFQARNFDLASQVLAEGRGYAPAARHPQFSLFLGYANAQRLGPLYADAAQKKDCAKAHAVDSLEASVRRDFAEGKAVGDSTQINQLLGGILTQARTRIGELVNSCPKP